MNGQRDELNVQQTLTKMIASKGQEGFPLVSVSLTVPRSEDVNELLQQCLA